MDLIKEHMKLLTVIAIVIVIIVAMKYGGGTMFEGFGGSPLTIQLEDVTPDRDGLSEAFVVIDKRADDNTVGLTVNGNLPYDKAGVFMTIDNVYGVYLSGQQQEPPLYIGNLHRYGDRRYRLQATVDTADFNKHNNIIVIRHSNVGRPDVPVLQGKLR